MTERELIQQSMFKLDNRLLKLEERLDQLELRQQHLTVAREHALDQILARLAKLEEAK